MRKALSLILALLLCLSLCACNSAETDPTQTEAPTTESTVPSEPEDFSDVTVSIVSITDKEQDDLWLYKQIEEKFGCKIEVIEIPIHTYNETIADLLTRDDLPTIFPASSSGSTTGQPFISIDQLVEYGEQGKFVDVMAPENLKKMPNFAKLFVEDQDAYQNYMITAAADGSHYLLPTYGYNRAVNHTWIYNEVAFEKAGVQWQGDPEGFLDMLRQLKAYYPNSYPMIVGAWGGTCDRMINTWGVNSSYAAYDWDTGEWFYGATSDAYFDMLTVLQTAYNEKLMSPDSLTQGSGTPQEPLMNYRSFLFNSWLGWMTMYNASFEAGGVDGHLVPAPTPVGPNGKTFEVAKFSNITGTLISNKDPRAAECAMAILDWMYDTSEDGGAWRNTVGPEEILEAQENGRYTWNYEDPYNQPLKTDTNIVSESHGMFQSSLTVNYCPESPYYTYNAEEQAAQDIGDEIGYVKAPPMFVIIDETVSSIYAASQKDIQEMQQKFIYENWDRAQFDAWVADFNHEYNCVIEYLNN